MVEDLKCRRIISNVKAVMSCAAYGTLLLNTLKSLQLQMPCVILLTAVSVDLRSFRTLRSVKMIIRCAGPGLMLENVVTTPST